MADNKQPDKVYGEGTIFYRKSAVFEMLRTFLAVFVIFILVFVFVAWGVMIIGARQAHKEARDIRRALRVVGTQYYGENSTIYDQNSPNGLVDGASELIGSLSTRDGEVILYSWDETYNIPLQFEYRTGLYRVIYTNTSNSNAGLDGEFRVYYSFELLKFEAD